MLGVEKDGRVACFLMLEGLSREHSIVHESMIMMIFPRNGEEIGKHDKSNLDMPVSGTIAKQSDQVLVAKAGTTGKRSDISSTEHNKKINSNTKSRKIMSCKRCGIRGPFVEGCKARSIATRSQEEADRSQNDHHGKILRWGALPASLSRPS